MTGRVKAEVMKNTHLDDAQYAVSGARSGVTGFWIRCLAVFLVCLLGLSGAAFAQDEAPPEEAPPEEAPPPEEPPPPSGPVDVRQVQIQVWISETNEVGLRDIGANLNYRRFVDGEEQSGSVQQVTTNVFDPVRDFRPVTLPVPDQNYFAPPMRPDENNNLGTGLQAREGFGLAASVVESDYGTLDAVFRAAESRADVDLISKPELLVINNAQATIRAGSQVPYQDVSYPQGTPSLSVDWRDIGVNMEVQPTILPNDFVQLNLTQLEVTDIMRIDSVRGVDLPVISKRSQTGFVMVPNGQTLVIGGLSSRVVRRTETRIPIVGALPLLGMPFRSRKSEADVTHLLVFVSPTIVDLRNMQHESINALEFWRERGAEWRNADRIEREIELMEQEL